MTSRLDNTLAAIEQTNARLAEIAAEIAAAEAEGKLEVEKAVAEGVSGRKLSQFGSPGSKQREKVKKLREEEVSLGEILRGLAVEREKAESARAGEDLKQAVESLKPHRETIETAYAALAEKLAAAVTEDWTKIADAFAAVESTIVGTERDILPAARSYDPNAQSLWNEATLGVFAKFSPMPSTVAGLVELVLGAMFDKDNAYAGRVNHLVPALSATLPDTHEAMLNIVTTARWGRAGGGPLAVAIESTANRRAQVEAENRPVELTAEQLEARAKHDAEVQRQWELRNHLAARKSQAQNGNTPILPLAVDDDYPPFDPSGTGQSIAQLRELAALADSL